MYIGEAARLSGTTVKSIRHYERIGLLPAAPRAGRYRTYDDMDVEALRFIKCAQQLGFRLRELQTVLAGYRGGDFPWERALQEIARKKQQLSAQIAHLQALHAQLQTLEQDLHTMHVACAQNRHASAIRPASDNDCATRPLCLEAGVPQD